MVDSSFLNGKSINAQDNYTFIGNNANTKKLVKFRILTPNTSDNLASGNTNKQITLTPLEEKIIKDFETSKFVVYTDAGLASKANCYIFCKISRIYII